MVTEVSEVQPEKALSAILVTLLGMVMEESEVQDEKALFPILVTLSGIVIELSEEQDEKALLPILVTLLPMIYSVTCSPKIVLILALSTIELESIVTEVNEVHSWKA
jgi:hypothetical protein